MKFFIDVGHGGTESGAVGHGMVEKNINLIVSQEVKNILKASKIDVVLSREVDSTVSLELRCETANRSGADYYVSIHHNANDGNTIGTEIYYSISGGKGKELAAVMGDLFTKSGRKVSLKARESEVNPGTDYYYVIKNTKMPAIIVEYGYMDSKDYINFDTVEELKKEAAIIADACLQIAGVQKSIPVPPEGSHWAQGHFDFLLSRGITIHEKRFDDKITRGEVFALLAQIVK